MRRPPQIVATRGHSFCPAQPRSNGTTVEIMSIQLHHERANVLRVDVNGTLLRRDLEACEPQVLDEARRSGGVRLLFVLRDFEGWDARDNWRDLSFYVTYGDAIERIAIVGDERWRDLALMFAAADLRKAPVEYFATDDIAEAREWLSDTRKSDA